MAELTIVKAELIEGEEYVFPNYVFTFAAKNDEGYASATIQMTVLGKDGLTAAEAHARRHLKTFLSEVMTICGS